MKRYGRAYYLQTNAEKTVFRVSDGNGYPFLLAKKIEVNVATRLQEMLRRGTRPRSEIQDKYEN